MFLLLFTHSLLHVRISFIQKQNVGEVNPAFIRDLANAVLGSSIEGKFILVEIKFL